MKRQLIVRCALLVALSFGVTACISVNLGGDPPKATVFTLQAPGMETKAASAQAASSTVVAIAKPELPPGLATERIALYFEQDRRMDYYADAKWSGPLDEILQEFVIGRAQQQLPRAVVGKPELASADYRLSIKVTSFGPVYKAAPDTVPRLDVVMTVTVIDLPEQRVGSQFTIRKSAPASENRLTPITNELGKLLQSAVDEALARVAPQFAAAEGAPSRTTRSANSTRRYSPSR
jgi:ABC-type uncharacterized transport system auxiliary subunit